MKTVLSVEVHLKNTCFKMDNIDKKEDLNYMVKKKKRDTENL